MKSQRVKQESYKPVESLNESKVLLHVRVVSLSATVCKVNIGL